jgi:hypothetical protein
MILLNQTMQPWLSFWGIEKHFGMDFNHNTAIWMLWPSIDAAVSFQMHDANLSRLMCTCSEHSSISYTVIERRFVCNEGKQALSMLPCMECQTCQRLERYRVADNIVDFVNSIQSIIHKQIINIIEKDSAADARPWQWIPFGNKS